MRSEKLFSTAVLELLDQLKVALAQLKLRPKDSPEVARSSAAAFQSLGAFLDHTPRLLLAPAPDGLRVNGQRLGAKNFSTVTVESALIAPFLDAGIRNIVFRKGCTLAEFTTFLDAFSRRFWDVKDAGDGNEINRRLQELQVLSVGVDETDSVGDVELPPKDAPAATPASGTPEVGPPGLLPLEKGRDGLRELARLLDAAPVDLRPGLRKVGAILVDAYRHDPRLVEVLKPFLDAEARDLMPAWMTDEVREPDSESGAQARARTLLARPAEEQAEPLLQDAAVLVRELLSLGRGDLAAKIMARLTGLLMDRDAGRRRGAAEALLSLQASWETRPLDLAREGFEGLLRSAFDEEKDETTYGTLAEIASVLADGRLRRSEPELALETLSLLRRHASAKESVAALRSGVALRAIERLIKSPGFPEILNRLRTGDPVALRVAESLGDAVAARLVAEMKTIELTTQRMPLAEAISRIGPGASAILAEELQKTASPTEALRLLEILPYAAPENIAIVALTSTLHHPVSAVRRRTAALLTDRAYPRSGELLLQAMKDEKDPTIRATLVEGLGKLRVSGGFEVLAAIADSRSESDDLRAGACTALARLGHAEAVPIIAGLAARSSRGLGLLKSASPMLRAAAIRALGRFPSNAAAREALRKLMDDSDLNLQGVARETLQNPEEAGSSTVGRDIQHAAGGPEVRARNVKLAGSLQEIPLDQVCQLVGGSEKTGLLMLSLEGHVGRIWFDQGMVVAAEFERRLDQDAVNAIARSKKGDFIFQPGERPKEARVRLAVPGMLLEAYRVADEDRK